MNKKIQELAEQAALLGPSSRIGNAHEATERFAESIINEIELYIEESEGDTDYLRFLIDKRLKNYTVEYNVNR